MLRQSAQPAGRHRVHFGLDPGLDRFLSEKSIELVAVGLVVSAFVGIIGVLSGESRTLDGA